MRTPGKKISEHVQRAYTALFERGLIPGEYPQKEFAALLNVSPQVVNNWERRGMSQGAMLKLQEFLGINVNWLRLGEKPMFLQNLPEEAPASHDELPQPHRDYPHEMSEPYDVYDARVRNLRALIDRLFDGVAWRAAVALDMKPPQLYRWFSTTSKDQRRITEDSARAIEAKLALYGVQHGDLDKINLARGTNPPMDVDDMRRARLKDLIASRSLAEVARLAGKPDSQVNDMVQGRKSFGEKVARAMEQGLNAAIPGLTPGWLVSPDLASGQSPTGTVPEPYPNGENTAGFVSENGAPKRYVIPQHACSILTYEDIMRGRRTPAPGAEKVILPHPVTPHIYAVIAEDDILEHARPPILRGAIVGIHTATTPRAGHTALIAFGKRARPVLRVLRMDGPTVLMVTPGSSAATPLPPDAEILGVAISVTYTIPPP